MSYGDCNTESKKVLLTYVNPSSFRETLFTRNNKWIKIAYKDLTLCCHKRLNNGPMKTSATELMVCAGYDLNQEIKS